VNKHVGRMFFWVKVRISSKRKSGDQTESCSA
jgi:hypothetical protein